MPYYLRLLSNPVIQQRTSNHKDFNKKRNTAKTVRLPANQHVDSGIAVQIKLSCTTDLGDAYYNGDLAIDVQLLQSEYSTDLVASGRVSWKRGMRVLSETVELQCMANLDLTKEYWLRLGHRGLDATSGRLSSNCMPEIINILAPASSSLRSASGNDINQHVLRVFDIPKVHHPSSISIDQDQNHQPAAKYVQLYIFEEMGESLARHTW